MSEYRAENVHPLGDLPYLPDDAEIDAMALNGAIEDVFRPEHRSNPEVIRRALDDYLQPDRLTAERLAALADLED